MKRRVASSKIPAVGVIARILAVRRNRNGQKGFAPARCGSPTLAPSSGVFRVDVGQFGTGISP